MTHQQESKLKTSEQYKQWKRKGLVEEIVDEEEIIWRWTELARKRYKYHTLKTIENFVSGQPIYPVPEDAERIDTLIRKE